MKTVFMKYALIALLVMFNPITASAQKNNLFADVGIAPGLSVTYNYKFAKHIGLGIGLQGYNFIPTITNRNEFVPAVFADVRLNSRQRKKHFFFYFLDLGIDFYKSNDNYPRTSNIYDNVPKNNGFYTGLGSGYFRRMTKRGGGLYASLKIIGNIFNDHEYNIVAQNYRTSTMFYGTGVISIGFKF